MPQMQSACPGNREWALRVSNQFTRKYPDLRDDIRQEALVGLVKAERHPKCPVGDEFRPFAYLFVRRGIAAFLRKLRRQRKLVQNFEDRPIDLAASSDWDRVSWSETRNKLAQRLNDTQRTIFLKIYGEDSWRTVADVAEEFEMHPERTRRIHCSALEALRDLPRAQQVA